MTNRKLNETMQENINEVKLNFIKIRRIVNGRSISPTLGKYLECITMNDFCSKEAETFALYGENQRAIHSLVEMKLGLDSIASILMSPELLINGIPDHYQSLFDYAIDNFERSYENIKQKIVEKN